MGRPKKPPTTVVRLPAELVARIDGLRGEVSRADYLDALVVRDDIDGPVSRKALGEPDPSVRIERGDLVDADAADQARERAARRGSPSPSLKRFAG